MKYKEDYEKIKIYIRKLKEQYGFKGLFHFTDFSNLKTIFKNGYLYSRSKCEQDEIDFKDGANHSVLEKADDYVHKCVRFYYREKTPTLYKNEGIKLLKYCNSIHIPIPVYLLFDEELLYLKNTVFTNGNATNSERGCNYNFFSNMDWDTIFHRGPFEMCDRDYIVNRRQAELLSENPVPLKYLKKIIFRCEADKKRAINLFGKDKRYMVDINLFSDKNFTPPKNEEDENNFINDYSIEYTYDSDGNRNNFNLSLNFQKYLIKDKYLTEIKVKDINKKYIDLSKYKNLFIVNKESMEITPNLLLRRLLKIKEWGKIEIWVNNVLCIEEFPLKDIIKEYRIDKESEETLAIHLKFRNSSFKNYAHRVKIFNSNNECIYTIGVSPEDLKGLEGVLKTKNCNDSWNKVNYYINDVLCISEYI